MDLNHEQVAALAELAQASSARLNEPVPDTEMRKYFEAGTASCPFGDFEGSPARFQDRWWRAADELWDPLDGETSVTLDADLERWQAACAAIGDDG
jgi:hypothetical protein